VSLAYHRRVSTLSFERAQQTEFARQLIESQERERKRIAAELHDSLGQNLLVIKNRALVGLNAPDDRARLLEQLDQISTTTSQAIAEVREIAYGLRPYQLDRLGLTRTLHSMLKKVAGASGLDFTVTIDDLDGRFPGDSAINVFRIVQEAVTNVVRHAAASKVAVAIAARPRDVEIVITDDGIGFVQEATSSGEAASGGFGLLGIAERATLSGGSCAIESAPGRGTTIRVTLPTSSGQDGR
jgi:signal transduction histidine kinase